MYREQLRNMILEVDVKYSIILIDINFQTAVFIRNRISTTTEQVVQRIIMSTKRNANKSIKLECYLLKDVVTSEYQFNRFDKTNLVGKVNVQKLEISSEPYSSWEKPTRKIWEEMVKKIPLKDFRIFCFLSSPYWKKDDRITRYYGLGKSLVKEFEIEPLDLNLNQ